MASTQFEEYPLELDSLFDVSPWDGTQQVNRDQHPGRDVNFENTRQTSDVSLGKRRRSCSKAEKKKRKRRKTSRDFTREEFISLMHLTQREAAKELDICLSTFKRQFSNLRPKLTWPTPSERQMLIRRQKFEDIIKLNENPECISIRQFEFGKWDGLYEGEIFSVDSLVAQYKSLKTDLKVLKGALKKTKELDTPEVIPEDKVPSPNFGGDINHYSGPWNTIVDRNASLALIDINMNIVASNGKFNQLVNFQPTSKGFNFSTLFQDLHDSNQHLKWYKSFVLEKGVQSVQWNETLISKSKERKHVTIVLHTYQESGAWMEIFDSQQFSNQVIIDNICIPLSMSVKPASMMTSDDDLFYHTKVIQVLKGFVNNNF